MLCKMVQKAQETLVRWGKGKKKLGKESCNMHDHRKENIHVTKLKGEVKKLEILTIIFPKVLTCFMF